MIEELIGRIRNRVRVCDVVGRREKNLKVEEDDDDGSGRKKINFFFCNCLLLIPVVFDYLFCYFVSLVRSLSK